MREPGRRICPPKLSPGACSRWSGCGLRAKSPRTQAHRHSRQTGLLQSLVICESLAAKCDRHRLLLPVSLCHVSLWVTVRCARRADVRRDVFTGRGLGRMGMGWGQGIREAFCCLHLSLLPSSLSRAEDSGAQVCLSPPGFDYLTITTSSGVPFLLFFLPGSHTKK